MRLLGLDQDSENDRSAFTRVLGELNLLNESRLSDARVDSIKNMLAMKVMSSPAPVGDSDGGSPEAALTKAVQKQPGPVGDSADHIQRPEAATHSDEECEAVLREYHAQKQRPQDLPDWFWATGHARRFDPPTDVFAYKVLDIETSSPRRHNMLRFHIVKVRRSAGYESVDAAPYFRPVGQRFQELDRVLGNPGLDKVMVLLEERNAEYRAAQAAWREARSKHRPANDR